jgi:hypothetical protein
MNPLHVVVGGEHRGLKARRLSFNGGQYFGIRRGGSSRRCEQNQQSSANEKAKPSAEAGAFHHNERTPASGI